jgi:hypothetical protein
MLGWMDEAKKGANSLPRLNQQEKNQLLADAEVSCKFKYRSSKFNSASLKVLVQHAWGCPNSYLHRQRKNIKESSKDAVKRCATILPPDAHVDEANKICMRSVIEYYDLAKQVFTSSRLHAVNGCCRIAQDNLDAVDRKEHNNCFKLAKEWHKMLDADTKATWDGRRRAHLHRQSMIT